MKLHIEAEITMSSSDPLFTQELHDKIMEEAAAAKRDFIEALRMAAQRVLKKEGLV